MLVLSAPMPADREASAGAETVAARPRSYFRVTILVLVLVGALVLYVILSLRGHTEGYQLVQDAGRVQIPRDTGSGVSDISCRPHLHSIPDDVVRLRCAVRLEDGRQLTAIALASSAISHEYSTNGARVVHADFTIQR
jgi:hypothetical protein